MRAARSGRGAGSAWPARDGRAPSGTVVGRFGAPTRRPSNYYAPRGLLAANLSKPPFQGRHAAVHLLRPGRWPRAFLRRGRRRRARGGGWDGVTICATGRQAVLALTHGSGSLPPILT